MEHALDYLEAGDPRDRKERPMPTPANLEKLRLQSGRRCSAAAKAVMYR